MQTWFKLYFRPKGIKIKGKYNLYEDGKKSSKLFLDLEKNWAIQNQIRLLKIGKKEIKDKNKILQNLYQFYEELFPEKVSNSIEVIAHYLKNISLPKLTKEQIQQWEGE